MATTKPVYNTRLPRAERTCEAARVSLTSAQELFDEQLPKALAAHPERAREVNAVFRFTITGEGGGDWLVDLTTDPPTCRAGDDGAAQCSIEVSAEDFRTMLHDGEAGMQLYFDGKLKVGGDPTLATRLPDLFAAIREPADGTKAEPSEE